MIRSVFRQTDDIAVSRGLYHFLDAQQMDTDCIEIESANYGEEQECNLMSASNGKAIQTFLKRHRVCNKSLALGKPLNYWKWHRKHRDENIRKYAVSPHYDSIKTEVMESGLISMGKFRKNVVGKAERYLKTPKCREMKSAGTIYQFFDLLFAGAPLEPRHLHSLLLYTDFTDFCTEFSRSCRTLSDEESLDKLKSRNSKYYHTSKALQELVQYFGVGHGDSKNAENGPFLCGLSCVLSVPEMAISFHCPMSTTKTKEIAARFATESGMVLRLTNRINGTGLDRGKGGERCFNVKPFTAFAEEDERLFFGSTEATHLLMLGVTVISTNKNYAKILTAFSKLDLVLNGRKMEDVTSKQTRILRDAIGSVLETEESLEMSKGLDQWALDSFYLMTLRKTEVLLNLEEIHKMKCQWMKDMLVYGTVDSTESGLFGVPDGTGLNQDGLRPSAFFGGDDDSDDDIGDILGPMFELVEFSTFIMEQFGGTANDIIPGMKSRGDQISKPMPYGTPNVVKGEWIAMFPNLETITIRCGMGNFFSVHRLLDELKAVKLPRSFSCLKIEAIPREWLEVAVDADLRARAAAMNMTVEYRPGNYQVIKSVRSIKDFHKNADIRYLSELVFKM